MKRKALGKGLSALLPDPEPSPPRIGAPTDVPISEIEPNPEQPRSLIDPVRLAELAASIRESGVVQPILVRRKGTKYEIVAGERRWRAAQLAGLTTLPVNVREVPDDRLLEIALVENIQRQDLSALEEAHAYQRLLETLSLSHEELARKVGRDRSTVANALRLLRLPTEIRELLEQRRIEAGHARALLALEHREDQLALAREAARRGLSVREVERRVAAQRTPTKATPPRADPNTRAAEERLHAALGTRVSIARRGGKGQIRIDFASEAELQRVFEVLLRGVKVR
jgi:ParB family chromosome partitioning protein